MCVWRVHRMKCNRYCLDNFPDVHAYCAVYKKKQAPTGPVSASCYKLGPKTITACCTYDHDESEVQKVWRESEGGLCVHSVGGREKKSSNRGRRRPQEATANCLGLFSCIILE